MFADMYIVNKREKSLDLSLISAYSIIADESYSVDHKKLNSNEYVLLITDKGQGFLKFGEKAFFLESGHIILISPQVDFHYHSIGGFWEFKWFEFSCEKQLDILENKSKSDADYLISELTSKCFSYVKYGKYETASSILGAILNIVIDDKSEVEGDKNKEYFFKIDQMIRRNLAEITIEELCEKLFVSDRTLRNIFRKHAKMSPIQYITNIKIEMAKYILLTTNKSINEISNELGFSNQFYFSKIFKQYELVSPLQYRNAKR